MTGVSTRRAFCHIREDGRGCLAATHLTVNRHGG